jgi:ElaA protein
MMNWTLKRYEDLSLDEFHDIIQLRINIFVVEQDCPYPELDNKDKIAYHFFGTTDHGRIVAYTRIFGPGSYFKEAAIGRVVVHRDFRNKKLGFELMSRSIDEINRIFDFPVIRIGAQTHLQKFYESLGFISTGQDYIEDGIPHIYMLLNKHKQ